MTESTRKKITKWFWILITFPVLLLIVMIFLVWAFADIPSFKDLENPDNKLATQVIAEDGEILTTFHIENRTYVSYDEISPNLVHAAVATEDVRFYKHSGIDFKGLGRVLVKTIVLRNSSQGGGSTITQQLAKPSIRGLTWDAGFREYTTQRWCGSSLRNGSRPSSWKGTTPRTRS